jgi:hypothetical protein
MNQQQCIEWVKQILTASGEGDATVSRTDDGGIEYLLVARGGEKYPESLLCNIGPWQGGVASQALMQSMGLRTAEAILDQRLYAAGTHPDQIQQDAQE